MQCPACETRLIITGKARLETIEEHVMGYPASLKDSYLCVNEFCPLMGNNYWNSDGEMYSKDHRLTQKFKKSGVFIDDNDAPFGSYQRKVNIEIYKKDENYDLFRIGRFRFCKVYHYESDLNGNILKRWWELVIWEMDKHRGYETLYVPGSKMLFYAIKSFHRDRHWKDTPAYFDNQSYKKTELWRACFRLYVSVANRLFPI